MRDFKVFVRQHVAPLALPPAREHKVVEEWAAQLEDAYDAMRAQGLSDDEAWSELQRDMPDWTALGAELLDAEPALLRLANRDQEGLPGRTARAAIVRIREMLATGLLGDMRSAARPLVKERGFSAAIMLTLAMCLGANAAVFTIVHAVLLRPLPVPEPDRLVGLGDVYPTITPNDILSNDAPSYLDRLEALTTLESQALFTYWFDTISIDGVPEELRGMKVTPSLFGVLRVAPALGRAFTEAEGEIGSDRKVILSHGLWRRLYGADPSAIGQSLRLGWTGQIYTIVGVMPRGFSFFDQGYDGHAGSSGDGVQFWIPLALTPEQKSDRARTRYGFFHIGRLQPGATVQQVQAQVDALHAATVSRFPQFRFEELGMYTAVTPLHDALTRGIRPTLYLLWSGAGFVLLIGAINVANLVLVRTSGRARELATRMALGAGRSRLVRQLILEAMVPAAVGGAAGAAIGAGILQGLAMAGLGSLPHAADVRMGGTVLGYIAGLTALVGLLIGLVPALAARGLPISEVLANESRTGTSGRKARLFRRGLVVAQVALSVVLLIAATLLLTSLRHLLAVDAGFDPERVTTATIFPPPSRYPDAQAVIALSNRLLERIRAVPGVEAGGITSNIPLSGSESPATISSADARGAADAEVLPSVVAVSPGYFEAMGTPLVRGRFFADTDRHDTLPVAIVDERLASRLWPGEDPLGRSIYRGDQGPFTIAGVVRNVRYESLAGPPESIGTAYFPHTQAPSMRRLRWIAVKTAHQSASIVQAIRSALVEIDPDLPLADIQTMRERTSRSLVPQSLATTLAGMFAAVALFLSLVGVYAVLANVVAHRTREFGIRMALGSTVRGVFQLVLREGATLIGAGLILGLAGALAMSRTLEGQLFGVQPTDPFVLGAVALGTGCVALLACLAPARRATRVPLGSGLEFTHVSRSATGPYGANRSRRQED